MSNRKKTILQIVCWILLSIPVCTGTYMYISQNIMPNDKNVYQEFYLEEISNCELLESVAKEVIIEGEGFAFDKIDTEKVGYEITPNGENIEFYYYLKDTYNDEHSYTYRATITLSKDYEIIEEEYSRSKEYFGSEQEYIEKRIENNNRMVPLLSILLGILLSIGIFGSIYLILELVAFLILKFKER